MANPFSKRRRTTDPRRDGRPGASRVPAATSPLPPRGVFALTGASGGVGTTTAACALASDIARRVQDTQPGVSPLIAEPRVCLLDLDFEAGACAHHLDRLPALTAEDLLRPSQQMDPTLLSAMTDQHVGGVAVIGAPNGSAARPDPRTVLAMVDAATQLFDFVVLDVPRRLEGWTPAVLAGADCAVVLAEPTVPSLHLARVRRLALASMMQSAGRALHPVVAKLERRGGRGMLGLKDVETALHAPPFATLPVDPEPLRVCINNGEPLATTFADSRYMRAVRQLSDRMLAQCEPAAVQAEAA